MKLKALFFAITCLTLIYSTCFADSRPGKIHNYIDMSIKRACLEESQDLKLDSSGKITYEGIICLLDSPNFRIRGNAVYALGEIRDPRCLELLIIKLEDQNRHMRRIAARALGKLQDPRALPSLLALAQNQEEDFLVRCTAIIALRMIGHQNALRALKIVASGDNRLLKKHALVAIARIRQNSQAGTALTYTPPTKK